MFTVFRTEYDGRQVVDHVPVAASGSRAEALECAVKSVLETARRLPSVKDAVLGCSYSSLADRELSGKVRRILDAEGAFTAGRFRWDLDEVGGPEPSRRAWVAIVRGESDREDPCFELMEATVTRRAEDALAFCAAHAANMLRMRGHAPTVAELRALRNNLEVNGTAVIAVDDGSCLHYGMHETLLPDV